MSITSSNNLAVNNSLSVNGNTVLGSDNSSTLIVNSLQTFNNGTTITGNLVQTSGTFSTSSSTNYLNGDVIINGSRSLTTGTGTTTINGTTQANQNVIVLSGKSLYIADSILSKYLRNYHDGTNAYIDYTGDLNFRNSGTTTSLSLSGTTNQMTFNYVLNTKGISNTTTAITNGSTMTQTGLLTTNGGITNSNTAITNNSTLSQVGTSSFTGLVSTNGGITNSNTAITNNSTLSQVGTSTFTGLITTNGGITNNGTLTQVGASTCTGLLTTNGGITNSNTAITNNSTLSQVGASTFTGLASFGGLSTSGLITTTNIEMYSAGTSYIDMKNQQLSDFDVRLRCTNGVTGAAAGQGDFTIESARTYINSPLTVSSGITVASITNSGTLTQNSTANINSALNVTGLPFFDGTSNQVLPTVVSGNSGLSIYWNGTGSAHGETNFMNNAQAGDGGFAWHTRSTSLVPRMLMYLDTNGSLSSIKNISMSGDINTTSTTPSTTTTTGALKVAGGAGIVGNCYVGGIGNFAGNVNITSTTSTSSNTTGALTVAGGVGINGSLNVNGNSNFSNNLSCANFTTQQSFTAMKINNNYHITVRGYTTRTAGVSSYSWTPSTTNTGSTASNFSFILPSNGMAMLSQYSYYIQGSVSYQGLTPYHYIRSSATNWNQYVGTTVGSFNWQPPTTTITGTDPFYYYAVLPAPTTDGDVIQFSFSIWMY